MIDQLWPSLEANAPRASFDMALSRLRKLIDVPDAIRVTEGKVGLNPAVVWTDVAAFEHVWERLARLEIGADETTSASDAAAPLADCALTLYRDRLLGSEDATGALQSVRERLAIKFARVVVDHGARLERLGQWRGATALYERALTRDTLAEPFIAP